MKIKELDRTVNIAWSPIQQHPVLLAAGTAAQLLDASFNTSAAMEIYSLNLGEPGLDMELKASIPSQSRFHRITWGGWNVSRDHPSGIIVGGCESGRLQMYSASRLLAKEESLIFQNDSHTGPVRAIDFNSYQTNILATGSSESEIFIWDLNNTSTPMSPGTKSQPNEDVLWLAWNKQVKHILASTFSTRCVIYDLRKTEPIIKLSDSNTLRIKWKVVEWNPAVATQLCLASEDDSSPVVQLWDLRFASAPIKSLEGHSKGLLSIAWCDQDPDLLLGSGKDNKILCWNPNANEPGGEVVCEILTPNLWNFEVAWCPRNPSLIASCSFDGHTSIHSLLGGQQQVQTSNKIADSFPGMEQYADAPPVQPSAHNLHHPVVELRKAPKWLKRPVGASFAFGGKLVMFSNESRSVYVSQVVTEPELLERSQNLMFALSNGRFDEICASKKEPIWAYIAATLEQCPRAAIKKLLGFTQTNFEVNNFIGEPANARLKKTDVDKITDGIGNLNPAIKDDSFNNFNNSTEVNNGINMAGDTTSVFEKIGSKQNVAEKIITPFTIPTGDDVDGMISKAILSGNIEVAVELCLQQNRMADAIVLAMTAGSDLLAKTQYRYFQQCKGNLTELISAVVTEEWIDVVNNCNLASWKEALAAVLTYSKDEELPALCDALGQRLERKGEDGLLNAEICYIAAKNLSQIIKLRTKKALNLSTSKLQELVELIIVLQRGVRVEGGENENDAAKIMSRYAELLAAQGELATALSYLFEPQQENLKELHDRLQCALGQKPTYTAKTVSQPTNYYQQSFLQNNAYNRRRSSNSISSTSWQQGPGVISQSNNIPSSNLSNTSISNQIYNPAAAQPPSMLAPANQSNKPPLQPASQSYTFATNPPLQSSSQNYTFQTNPPQMNSQVVNQPPKMMPVNTPYYPAPTPPVHSQPPTVYNPVTNNHLPKPFNPPGNVAPPPPPPTNSVPPTSLHRSSPGPGAQSGRQKYVLDPSLVSGSSAISYGNQSSPSPQVFQPLPLHPTPPQSVTPRPQEQPYNPSEFRTQAYAPQYSGPAGWNDPPAVSSTIRNQPKENLRPQTPITHPLYGSVPEPSQINQYQSQMGGPPMNSGYGDPPPSLMSHQIQQPHHPNMQPQQHAPMLPQHVGYNQPQPPPEQSYIPQVVKAPEPPKPKPPLPEEHLYLQTVFEELRNRCSSTANNPQSKRKLEDVARKLEMLYDSLRDNKLSPETLNCLHQLVQLVQNGDYTGGLALHTQLISGPDFAQIASFMPGLKILFQLALQLGVYLQ